MNKNYEIEVFEASEIIEQLFCSQNNFIQKFWWTRVYYKKTDW